MPLQFSRSTKIALFLLASASAGRLDSQARNNGDIKFWAVADLAYDPTEPALLGAKPANPKDFPAVLYSASRRGRCTSTLIGPRVLLTAAHCVGDGAKAEMQIAQVDYTSVCTHSPDYAADDSADWALCLVDRPVPGITFETVNGKTDLLSVGDSISLTGFGCSKPDGTGDGIYRIGQAPVQSLPQAGNSDIETVGSVALCYGDSGGPAFAFVDDLRLRRVQVSVNSRGDIHSISHLSSLSTPAAQHFLSSWSASNSAGICGVTTGIGGCR